MVRGMVRIAGRCVAYAVRVTWWTAGLAVRLILGFAVGFAVGFMLVGIASGLSPPKRSRPRRIGQRI